MFVRGNNRLPRTRYSRPGKHPLSALFRAPQISPGESTHILCTSVSPEVHITPRRPQGFGNLPKSRPGFREIPYATTVSSLWSYGVSASRYPARVGVPFRIWGFASTIRTLPNILCGLPKQTHKSLNLLSISLALSRQPTSTYCGL